VTASIGQPSTISSDWVRLILILIYYFFLWELRASVIRLSLSLRRQITPKLSAPSRFSGIYSAILLGRAILGQIGAHYDTVLLYIYHDGWRKSKA